MRIVRVVTTVEEFNAPDGFTDWSHESRSNYLAELQRSGGYKVLARTESLSAPDATENVAATASD
ncbi:hypothetical protein ACIRU3_03535 [Streptomyces sp. NPDC101151]|uniref:hypothetical protein n=1 Tax=Streptomyces sp. NPDC101151 TaxID=3366115 RepID=UPI00382EDBBD